MADWEQIQSDAEGWAREMSMIEKPVMDAALHLNGEVRQEIREKFRSGRVGGLGRSYNVKLLKSKDGQVKAGVYSDLVYAKIQDEGGTINAKRKWLAIPLKEMVVGKWPRTMQGLFRIKSKKGNELLVRKKGKNGIEPLFALKTSVTLTGKDYLGRAINNAQDGIDQIMGKHIKVAFE